jgi:hypothetical protein
MENSNPFETRWEAFDSDKAATAQQYQHQLPQVPGENPFIQTLRQTEQIASTPFDELDKMAGKQAELAGNLPFIEPHPSDNLFKRIPVIINCLKFC